MRDLFICIAIAIAIVYLPSPLDGDTINASSPNDTLLELAFDNYNFDATKAAGDGHAVVFGNPVFMPGKHGSAIVLSKGNYVEFSAAQNMNHHRGTLEFFFNFNVLGENTEPRRHIVTIYNHEGERFYIRRTAKGVINLFFVNNSNTNMIGATYPEDGKWHHFAITWQEKQQQLELNLYIDGVKKSSQKITPLPDFSKGRIILGAYSKGAWPMNGLIDDFRISGNPCYTAEEYPALASIPDISPFVARFEELKKQSGSEKDETRIEIANQESIIEAEIEKFKLLPPNRKNNAVVTIQEQIKKLESMVLPLVWWSGKKQTPFAAVPFSCMNKISSSWDSIPDENTFPMMNSAGQEWQAFQIAVLPGFKAVKNIEVKAMPLVGKGGVIPESNIQIFEIRDLHSPDIPPGQTWADPLYRLDTDISLDPGRIVPLWVSVKIPAMTPPGVYLGKIIVTNTEFSTEILYRINVYGFDLPIKPRLRTAFGFSGTWMAEYYKYKAQEPISTMMDKYLNNMLEHKVSPKSLFRGGEWNNGDRYFLAPKIVRQNSGEWQVDFTDYDRQLDRLLPLGLNTIMVGLRLWDGGRKGIRRIPYVDDASGKENILSVPATGKDAEAASKQIVGAWFEHLKKRGLSEMAYTYTVDEPNTKMKQQANIFGNWIHQAAPELSNMITATPSADCPSIDIWCSLTETFSNTDTKKLYEGKKIWLYVCASPLSPNPNFFISQSALENRLPLWLTIKFGAEGFLYYETARSMMPNYSLTWAGFPGTAGDGILVYPGPDGPINSVRFEYVRQGIQDVEYFLMLKDLIKTMPDNDPLKKEANELLLIPDGLIKNSAEYNQDWKVFAERKHRVGLLIEKILQAHKGK